ncbi:aromatic-ring-hydroxylating dioxygenase subunit beta [Streptomyces pathocidini]|uniref:Aromatic-ring-hydroxylating dioxygenase subunit beta n=1 Tax=Streptomyces pathocidini TaxID=1650571 RepID=A0ABW7UWI4_9ACTN|nr:aromatic-ring-hydroxylating dioxygenase subunit beta [Streptomyces pathocidini]
MIGRPDPRPPARPATCPEELTDGPFPDRGARLPGLDPEITAVLTEESAALDEGEHQAWLDTLDPAFRYEIPVPLLREDPVLPRHSPSAVLFEATKRVLELKFGRAGLLQAWSDRPATTTRHFLGSVRVFAAPASGVVRADANLLVTGNRGTEHTVLVSAARQDLLRRRHGRWVLLRRRVLLDVEVATHEQLSVIF